MEVRLGDKVQYVRGNGEVWCCVVVRVEKRLSEGTKIWGNWHSSRFDDGATRYITLEDTPSFRVLSKPEVDKEYEEMLI